MDQDTLEEYLLLAEKIEKDANIKNILTTAQKRKESERKALAIVQLFLETNVSAELFLKSLGFLNTSYYEDVAEERGLMMLCGYPLCSKRITKYKHRYQICNKVNRVYDLEEYGNFCSCFCFDAFEHIKSQILDSPLWLRDIEDIPEFNLLVKKKNHGSVGINIKSKKSEKDEDYFIPVSSFAKLSLEDFGDTDISVTAMNKEKQAPVKKINNSKLSTVLENDEETENINDEITHGEICYNEEDTNKSSSEGIKSKCKDILIENKKKSSQIKLANSKNNSAEKSFHNLKGNSKKQTGQKSNLVKAQCLKDNKDLKSKDLKSITEKIKSKTCKRMVTMIDPLPIKVDNSRMKNIDEMKKESMNKRSLIELKFLLEDSVSVENSIRNILKKWISLETLIFIHGEEKIKKILDENKLSEQFEKLKIHQLEIEQQKKYISLCRKLCEREIFEEKVESLMIKNKLRPIPDYNTLKKESKEFKIKVKTFYGGDLHETPDPNFGENRVIENINGQEPTLFPSDDPQNVRYQILSDTLNKSIKFLVEYIKCDSSFISTEMNKLIRTFDVDAKNIVFKPVVRNYLGLICLRILSLKDSTLHEELEKKEFLELENSVFKQLPGKKNVLTNTLKLINDVDSFVEYNVKS